MTWILVVLGVCVVALFLRWFAKIEIPEATEATESPGDHEAAEKAMDQLEIAKVVRRFMRSSGGATLWLPDGWFGRPHDNIHMLSSVGWEGPVLRIVLDRHNDPLTLALRGPRQAHADREVLTIEGSAEVVAELPYYGDRDRTRLRTYREGGTVKFFS